MATKKLFTVALLTVLFGLVGLGSLGWLISAAQAAPYTGFTSNVCLQIDNDQFELWGQRYVIQGVNYYHKDNPWDKFWPFWLDKGNRSAIEQELDIAQSLGINTLRIFLRWKDFTVNSSVDPTVPLVVKRGLDEFLSLAAAKQMRVVVTLFDGMINEGSGSLYVNHPASIAHLDSLLTPFENNGRTVDFSNDCRILAWDIKNEPDRDYYKDANNDGIKGIDLISYSSGDLAAVQSWVDTMIQHIRSKDNIHPITVGVYGAVVIGSTLSYSPTIVGYYANDIANQVDFLSVHYSLPEENFPDDLDSVKALANNKPVVIEEFALHTWADSSTNPHKVRDQAAYYNAILSTAEAKHIAGMMFWTLTDFKKEGVITEEEKQYHEGILHNATVTTTEVMAPMDYGEKPAASVVREHFRPLVAYLDTFDGYVDNSNCNPPLGWNDNFSGGNGGTIITCNPLSHTFAPSQLGQARITKWAGFDGVITSPVLERIDINLSPQLVVEVLTHTVVSTFNLGPINLDIGVQATDEVTPTWLASNLIDSSVDLTSGLKLPQTIYLPLPEAWSIEKDFQAIFRLQDHIVGNTGYSAGFEFGYAKIGDCPAAPPPSVTLEGKIQKLFRQEFNERTIEPIDWNTVHGSPYLFNCSIVLTTTRKLGVPSKTELRSNRLFEPTSMLVISATTHNWQGENKEGDTSFGFEGWDANCHHAAIVTSRGQLGLIEPLNETIDCNQLDPPTKECYLDIQNWDTLRTEPHEFAILWTSKSVTLTIDGVPNVASASCTDPPIPQIPLPIRLNANVFNEESAGEENHYDQDVLSVDYLYVPSGIGLPVILNDVVATP